MNPSFRHAVLGGVAVFALASISLTSPASAQDAYDWTGFHVGGAIGASWGDIDNTYTAPGPPSPPGFRAGDAIAISNGASNAFDPTEFHATARAGYDHAFDIFVFGGEVDFGYLGVDESFGRTFGTPVAGNVTTGANVEVPWLFTARARLGVTFDGILVYATGGVAVADVEFSQVTNFPGVFTNGPDVVGYDRTRVGWTAGGGFEIALGDQWSATGEYLYVDLGDISETTFTASPFARNNTPVPYGHNLDLNWHIVRVGLNYRFCILQVRCN